jgi:2-phospho-L-lactate guanylyltransferase
MRTVLLPVKGFSEAKQRLASALDPDAREGLARAMLTDVLNTLSRTHAAERVIVFTAADEIMQMARPFGFETVLEKTVVGHSAAVNHMVEELSATSSRILAIAADLPRRDWTGTNGVVFISPARIAMEYGQGSFRRHLSKVSAARLRSDVMSLPGIAFDIDTQDDLQAFLDDPRKDSQTWRYLSRRL